MINHKEVDPIQGQTIQNEEPIKINEINEENVVSRVGEPAEEGVSAIIVRTEETYPEVATENTVDTYVPTPEASSEPIEPTEPTVPVEPTDPNLKFIGTK